MIWPSLQTKESVVRRVSSVESLIPNTDTINQASFTPNAQDATGITVNTGQRFKPGDQVRPGNAPEVLLVTAVAGNVLTVVRRYGGTPASNLANGQKLTILGNAAVEGADAPPVRLSTRFRQYNYTQIFTTTVEVSGTLQAVRKHGVADELDYQKQERLRELLRPRKLRHQRHRLADLAPGRARHDAP